MADAPIATRTAATWAPGGRVIRLAQATGVLFAVFFAMLVVVERAAPTELDLRLTREIQAITWGPFDLVAILGSEIGGGGIGYVIAPTLLGLAVTVLRRWTPLLMLAGIVALHFVLISPKLFVETHRPSPRFGVDGGGGFASFPSGHVQWAVSFWGFVALLAWHYAPRPYRQIAVACYVAMVAATMIGRIELGKHWPIDTVGGVVAGLIALLLVITAQCWLRPEEFGDSGTSART